MHHVQGDVTQRFRIVVLNKAKPYLPKAAITAFDGMFDDI